MIKDRQGKEIHVGCTAMWWDFEEDILRGPYEVYKIPNEEMVCLSNASSEVECPPSEVFVVEGKYVERREIYKIISCPYCGSKDIESEDGVKFKGVGWLNSHICHSCGNRFGIEKF